jgi:hypothetical protein
VARFALIAKRKPDPIAKSRRNDNYSAVTFSAEATRTEKVVDAEQCKYQKTVGKEKVEWPVTEIVVSSFKKLGKAEKVQVAAGEQARSDLSEEVTDAMCRSKSATNMMDCASTRRRG